MFLVRRRKRVTSKWTVRKDIHWAVIGDVKSLSQRKKHATDVTQSRNNLEMACPLRSSPCHTCEHLQPWQLPSLGLEIETKVVYTCRADEQRVQLPLNCIFRVSVFSLIKMSKGFLCFLSSPLMLLAQCNPWATLTGRVQGREGAGPTSEDGWVRPFSIQKQRSILQDPQHLRAWGPTPHVPSLQVVINKLTEGCLGGSVV